MCGGVKFICKSKFISISIISIKLKDGATIFNKCLLSDSIGGRTDNKIARWFLELLHRHLDGL